MKLLLLSLTAFSFLYSCTPTSGDPSKFDGEQINYRSTNDESELVHIDAELSVNIKKQELVLELELKNNGKENVSIKDLSVSTAEGLACAALNPAETPVALAPGKSVHLSLKFNPFSHLDADDEAGRLFKPAYSLNMNYKGNLTSVLLPTTLSAAEYKVYQTKYSKQINTFIFGSNTKYAEKQKEYLDKFKDIVQSSFINLGEKELAVSGLNFRLKCIQKKDSINAELMIINHSSFPIKINPDSLNIFSGQSKVAPVEKVSGSRMLNDIIQKGDRVSVTFKGVLNPKNDEKLYLSLKNAFLISNGKPLFHDHIQLVKKSNL